MSNKKNLIVLLVMTLFILPSLSILARGDRTVERMYIKDSYIVGAFGMPLAPASGLVAWITEYSDGTVSYRNPVPLMRDFSIKGIVESQENGLKRYRFTFPQLIDREEYNGECVEEAYSFNILKAKTFGSSSSPEIYDEKVEFIIDSDNDGNLTPYFKNIPDLNGCYPEYWLCVTDKNGNLVNFQASYDCKFYLFEPQITHLPEDAVVEIWKSDITEEYSSCGIYKDMEVEVAKYGENLYLRFIGWSGIDPYFSIDGTNPGHKWVKGKIDDDLVLFEPGQHVGITPFGQMCNMYLGFCKSWADSAPLWMENFYTQTDLPIILEYTDNELKSADQKWLINSIRHAGIVFSEGEMGCPGHWGAFQNFVLTPKDAGVDEFAIEPLQNSDKCFDLMGREIANPRKGTIYIQNGKKYVGR